MDPATGASTWAFGNHKWVRYIGIFTRKANVRPIARNMLIGE